MSWLVLRMIIKRRTGSILTLNFSNLSSFYSVHHRRKWGSLRGENYNRRLSTFQKWTQRTGRFRMNALSHRFSISRSSLLSSKTTDIWVLAARNSLYSSQLRIKIMMSSLPARMLILLTLYWLSKNTSISSLNKQILNLQVSKYKTYLHFIRKQSKDCR